jgi:hypothetical protein
MANTKISALTSATTPVAGTEVLPIVQSSATKQVSIANLTAGRSVSGTSFVVTGSTIPANGLYLPAANAVGLATNTTNAVYIDSNQNVGIGITPNSKVDILGSTSAANRALRITPSTEATTVPNLRTSTIQRTSVDSVLAMGYCTTPDVWYLSASYGSTGAYKPLAFATSDVEAGRFDLSGNLLVGTTSALISSARRGLSVLAPTGTFVAAAFANDGGSSAQTIDVWNKATTGNNVFISFSTEATATERGSIGYNRTGGLTTYNTTSDYRAKDISGPVINSGALIDSVPVYMGKMKWATEERPMFIAHETPSYAHTGVKDAVDVDGNPVYQQMDASALIPVMWAEIQSLRKRLADANIA